MKSFNLLRVISPKGKRWYVNGVRVSRDDYEMKTICAVRRDTFQTTIAKNGTIRHYHVATI